MGEAVARLPLVQLAWGMLAALAVGYMAKLAGALTGAGAVAAAAVGGAVLGAAGGIPTAALLGFFVSSSLLSRLGRSRKAGLAARFVKGGPRDAGQVLANGSVAAMLALAHAALPGPAWLAGIFGALAAANADTWGTEIGVLAGRRPRLITTGKSVEPGTSGAVTALGLLASLGGAGLIGLLAPLGLGWLAGLAVLAAGMAGSLIDSLLGATIQSGYYCAACQMHTERHPRHNCGNPTTPVKGLRWLGNDLVNFAATVVGALLAVIPWLAWAGG